MRRSLSHRLGAVLLLCGLAACARTGPASTAAPAPRPSPDSLAPRIDRIFAQFDQADSPGCALGVYDHGVLRYARGYGMADVARAEPIGTNTLFDLASVSKQFVAGLIALLVDEGRVSMDDDVRRWVPELPDFGARITIGQLVHHTSGLPDYIAYRAAAGGGPPATFEAAVASIARRPVLNFAPGTAFSYTNVEYDILRVVVERATRSRVRDFATERLLRPLGMSGSRMIGRGDPLPGGVATGYVRDVAGVRAVPLVSSTAVFSNVNDLLRWDENFYSGRVGGGRWTRRVVAPGVLTDGTPTQYAFGNFVGSYQGLPVVRHDGSTAGFSTYLIRFPTQRLSVAVLCNIEGVPAATFGHRIADLLLDISPPQSAQVTTAPRTEELSRVAGLYIDTLRGEARRLAPTATGLSARPGGGELVRGADGVFRNADGTVEITFTVASDGRSALRVRVPAGGDSRTFVRVEPWTPLEVQLEEFVGTYESASLGARHVISRRDGELHVQVPGGRVARLRPLTADTFEDVGGEPRLAMLRFTRDAHGRITGYTLHMQRAWGIMFERR